METYTTKLECLQHRKEAEAKESKLELMIAVTQQQVAANQKLQWWILGIISAILVGLIIELIMY